MPTRDDNEERDDFRAWLDQQFQERRAKNSRFSLRAFGKLLKMDASTVGQILSGKRNTSLRLRARVMDTLKASEQDRREILGDAAALMSQPLTGGDDGGSDELKA